jgi:NAD(P)-dependent dehydrogenase (short-subunit alcohol dehydrogenase family)
MDFTNDASVDAAFEALNKKTNGQLDVLINNAGIFMAGLSETYTPEQVRSMFDVNVFGTQRVMRAALPEMRKRKSGLVITIGSILGRVTIPSLGFYGASKHATEAMMECYRYELSQLGIDVVLVQPSGYPTQLYAAPQQASDAARAGEYGDIAAIPESFAQFLQGVFNGATPPDPHDVAKTLAELIATPGGKRPARVVVGAPFGADAVNAAVEPIQAQLIRDLGFDNLSRLKVE